MGTVRRHTTQRHPKESNINQTSFSATCLRCKKQIVEQHYFDNFPPSATTVLLVATSMHHPPLPSSIPGRSLTCAVFFAMSKNPGKNRSSPVRFCSRTCLNMNVRREQALAALQNHGNPAASKTSDVLPHKQSKLMLFFSKRPPLELGRSSVAKISFAGFWTPKWKLHIHPNWNLCLNPSIYWESLSVKQLGTFPQVWSAPFEEAGRMWKLHFVNCVSSVFFEVSVFSIQLKRCKTQSAFALRK